jgi:hypothetical protein
VIVDDRNSPQKHVWRARIVLATADGLGTATIMRTTGVSKTFVWRWQERFMSEGVDGLLRDKTRPARIARLTDDVAERRPNSRMAISASTARLERRRLSRSGHRPHSSPGSLRRLTGRPPLTSRGQAEHDHDGQDKDQGRQGPVE